jgi:hypothetical protein
MLCSSAMHLSSIALSFEIMANNLGSAKLDFTSSVNTGVNPGIKSNGCGIKSRREGPRNRALGNIVRQIPPFLSWCLCHSSSNQRDSYHLLLHVELPSCRMQPRRNWCASGSHFCNVLPVLTSISRFLVSACF